MIKLSITLDNLDDAIAKLEQLASDLQKFPSDAVNDAVDRIEYNHVKAEPSGEGINTIVASDRGIAFQEYGAGFYAQDTKIGDKPSYPGVWSEDHKRTFQDWQGHDFAYPYNQQPKKQLQNEVKRFASKTEEKARTYFDH